MIESDYYSLLEIVEGAGEAEVKTAYRRLALRYHPDRNDGDRAAEERFKQISVAYAVLSDPARRAAYDQARLGGPAPFDFSRQDVFEEMLRNMMAGGFRDLGPEFARAGLRFDEAFLRQVLFGAGPFVVRGFFFSGGPGGIKTHTMGGGGPVPARRSSDGAGGRLLGSAAAWTLRQLGRAALALLTFGLRRLDARLSAQPMPVPSAEPLDLTYRVLLTRREARRGKSLDLSYPRGGTVQRVCVKVPPRTTSGTTLRLAEMGLRQGGRCGDLLIQIDIR